MCIIVVKNKGVEFPTMETLRNCFERNPHGCGVMISDFKKKQVIIEKGFMSFSTFEKRFNQLKVQYDKKYCWVFHFRISTGGLINESCTHPYPLSNDMNELKAKKINCNIGVAHNGYISCCNSGLDYNDTMNYIQNYLYYIVENDKNYWKNQNKIELIKNTCGSRLAILDNESNCVLIGNGWQFENGIYYSNDTYKKRKQYKYNSNNYKSSYSSYYRSLFTDEELKELDLEICKYDSYYNNKTCEYDFEYGKCPFSREGNMNYCDKCKNYYDCFNI